MALDVAQKVEAALAALGVAVLDRLREATPAKHWSEPPRVTVETKTKIRPSGAITTMTVVFDLPEVSVRVERNWGETNERIVTRSRSAPEGGR